MKINGNVAFATITFIEFLLKVLVLVTNYVFKVLHLFYCKEYHSVCLKK